MLLDSNIIIYAALLITRNSADFNWIKGLALLDPLIEEQE